MRLKDRNKTQDEDEKLWYERAFGPLRNMMKITLTFRPPPDKVQPGKLLFFAKVNYQMFPEMKMEFKEENYPQSHLYQIEEDNDDPDFPEYHLTLDVPYGSWSASVFYREVEP